jgi:DNA/RNA-binding domain of Phe-tRNA-synthetase-like protein
MKADETLPTLQLVVDPALEKRLRVGSFSLEPVHAGERPSSLESELLELEERYRMIWPEPTAAQDALHPARKLYHARGIDPSKTRPSSEALLRRVLQKKGLYRINAVVDAANLASLILLLPVGLYDAEKIRPPVVLRLGHTGEEYEGIRKDMVHVAGRPVLVDLMGPFGNPTSDSLRTCVTEETKAVWFVLFAPVDYPEMTLREDLARAHGILKKHAGA